MKSRGATHRDGSGQHEQARSGQEPTDGDTSKTTQLTILASAVAVALVLLYLVFVILQWNSVESAGLTYARRSELLSGLEALAFAAAGALLGTTVQRQVTKKAEDEAHAARREARGQAVRADNNEADAEKGRALHNLAKAKVVRTSSARVRGESDETSASDIEDLLNLAAQYDA